MAKHGKKKGGLQRKVSSVFKQVSVPQQEGDQQVPTEPAQDGSSDAPSRPMSTDSLVSQSSLMKKICRSQGSSDKAAPDRNVGVPSKETTPNRSNLQTIEVEEPSEVKISTDDELKPDRAEDISSGMMSPDYIDSHKDFVNEPTPSEDMSSKAEPDVIDGIPRTIKDESTLQPSSVKEPPQTENISERTASREKSWVPPKPTIPDHPIAQGSSTKKTERKETARDEVEPEHANSGDSGKSSAVGNLDSEDSLVKRLYQAENTPEISDTVRPAKTPYIPEHEETQSTQKSESEKRYGPETPVKEAVPSAPQPETMDLPEIKGPSFWQQINNKFFAPKPGVSPTRQKVMAILIPILAIIMIFIFRQVLSKPPRTTKGATTEEKTLVVKADSGQEIDWQIPKPLPTTMRDPSQLPAQDNTQTEEQNETAPKDKSELIDLGAIVYSHDKSSAVVNGRIVHAGDIVSGITVLRINRESVEFELEGERWIQSIRD